MLLLCSTAVLQQLHLLLSQAHLVCSYRVESVCCKVGEVDQLFKGFSSIIPLLNHHTDVIRRSYLYRWISDSVFRDTPFKDVIRVIKHIH